MALNYYSKIDPHTLLKIDPQTLLKIDPQLLVQNWPITVALKLTHNCYSKIGSRLLLKN